MKLIDQVSNLELSKKLKELGVKQKSLFWWVNEPLGGLRTNGYAWQLEATPRTRYDRYDYISAFTVAELGELLPKKISYYDFFSYPKNDGWICDYSIMEDGKLEQLHFEKAKTEADARAKMLIYLIENKLVEVK